MADFSTDFSPAQRARANTVAPVQVSPVPNFDINPFIEKGLSIFAKLGDEAAKRKAEEQTNAVLKQYIDQENTIAEQQRAGTIDASKAGTLSRANYQKFIASNPGLIKPLSEARKNIYEGTETGAIADEVKDQKERDKAADAMATEYGFDMSQPMSPELRKARHEAAYASKRAEKLQQRLTAEQSYQIAGNAEQREQYKFGKAIEDQRTVDEAEKSLKYIASSNYDAFSILVRDRMGSAQTPEQVAAAQLEINQELFRIRNMAAQAAGAKGKDLVGTYLGAFENLASFATSTLKPVMKLDSIKQQLEEQKAFAQLLFMQNPRTAAAVAANSLVPNAPLALTQAQTEITSNIATVSGALEGTPLYRLPQVVGTETERPTYDAVKEATARLSKGTASGDLPKLSKEVSKAIDVFARQADQITKAEDFDPRHLDKLMGFFSDPEVGKAIESGKISHTQRKAMANALGAYSESVVKSITQTLGETLRPDIAEAYAAKRERRPAKAYQLSDMISDIKFEGGKLTLYPANAGTESTKREAEEKLRQSEAALTRIIRVGAHNDGTTDYGKWWEANKHHVMPNVYADPERFPAGFVNEKTGYKFKGGMWTNPNNWEKVSSGPKQ